MLHFSPCDRHLGLFIPTLPYSRVLTENPSLLNNDNHEFMTALLQGPTPIAIPPNPLKQALEAIFERTSTARRPMAELKVSP